MAELTPPPPPRTLFGGLWISGKLEGTKVPQYFRAPLHALRPTCNNEVRRATFTVCDTTSCDEVIGTIQGRRSGASPSPLNNLRQSCARSTASPSSERPSRCPLTSPASTGRSC